MSDNNAYVPVRFMQAETTDGQTITAVLTDKFEKRKEILEFVLCCCCNKTSAGTYDNGEDYKFQQYRYTELCAGHMVSWQLVDSGYDLTEINRVETQLGLR